MTDQELAEFLCCPVELVPRLRPEKRAAYERLAAKVAEVQLYDAGLGPKPTDAIVCYPRRKK